jgi:cytochrome c oxidase subunit 4
MKANASQWAQLLVVYGALMGLLALTAGASFLPGGWWSTPVALAIATAKAFLIFYFFMRLRGQSGLVRIFAVAGFFWLAILLVLTSADYLTRLWAV